MAGKTITLTNQEILFLACSVYFVDKELVADRLKLSQMERRLVLASLDDKLRTVPEDTPDDEHMAAIGAVPDLLAYAECQEAWSDFEGRSISFVGESYDTLKAVFAKHGLDATRPFPEIKSALTNLRRAALAKASPRPRG